VPVADWRSPLRRPQGGVRASAIVAPLVSNVPTLEEEKMRQQRSHRALLGKRPLLVSESRRDFDAVYDDFEKELMPQGIIERMYVTDAACIVWDIVRFRSYRVALVNTAFREALEELL
jgi:hypothetical protein